MSETNQWTVQIVELTEVLGAIHYSTEYYNGPFEPGTNQVVIDLVLENVGTEDGNIFFKLFEFPNTSQEQMLEEDNMFCAYTANYCNYGPIMITIPTDVVGDYQLGIKVWGEDETEPAWGSMGAYIWGQMREMHIIA